ncbi:MAG: M48 family metallopeptidase, partial [Desulfuromonadaceae bacterium]
SVASKSTEIKQDSVEWAGVTIGYNWCHSRRRTLGITVRADKLVMVRVPLRTPIKEIRTFVTSRAEWVLNVLKKLDKRLPRHQQYYSRGAEFMYLGEAIRLEFSKGPDRTLQLYDGLLLLTSPEIPSEDTVRKMITQWYRKKAEEIVKERSIECHHLMQAEGIPLPPITIRSMKTRWGSYSYVTKRIALSLNLIRMPLACLDYVIIHELCHIKVRHHGPDFWRMVSRYCPNYLIERKLFKQYV